MNIVFLHGMMFQAQTWSKAATMLKEDGIAIEFFAQQGKTQEAALLIEDDMEEQIGEVSEEFQGSKVEVMTAADVEKWQPKWRMNRP